MRALIKKIYLNTQIGKTLINPLLKLRTAVVPERLRLKSRFKRTLGYPLNLKNPKTFNEKINWLKLNERTPLHTICSDKYAVRDHIEKTIGSKYLIPLLYKTEDYTKIIPENLPSAPFIIKTNHDSSGGTIVFNKNEINWDLVQSNLKNRMKTNYSIFGKGEWQYKNIKPIVIVEGLLIDEDGHIPSDYKLHCFNGTLQFIQVDMDRHTNHTRNLYDINWDFIPCKWLYQNGKTIEKPIKYEEMKAIAEKLAGDFTYARVDLYLVKERVYFGEITFHSDSGNGKFIPELWDQKFGEALTLPIVN